MDRMLVGACRILIMGLCCVAWLACIDSFGTSVSAVAATETARINALEQRINALEQRIGSLERAADSRKAGDAGTAAASTVRAPFVVVDDDKRTLFRVDVEKSRARAIVGDPAGRRVVLGPTDTGANLVLFAGADATAGGAAILSARPDRAYLTVTAGGIQANLGAHVTDGGVMNLRNAQGSTIATITSTKDGRGYLELTNAAAAKMVEAGSLQSDKGYVLVQPYESSMSPSGDPSMLVGSKRR